MRKLLILTLGLFLFIGAYSQPNMRTTAFNHLRYGKLDKAKEAIDKAIEHPKTINDERTWFFYGNIYLAIHLSDEAAYKELDANALDKAYNAYKKALEFDAKGSNTEEINERLVVCAEQYFNRGVGFYNESKFAEASSAFENAGMINAGVGITDTISYFYTAQSAYFSDQYDISKNYFGK